MTTRLDRIDVRSRMEWRSWLASHHDSCPGVWMVFHKRAAGVVGIEYEDAVREAICYGWIDSAKRAETKERWLREALELLAAGKKSV